jgi:hypothetical protein
MAPRLRLAAVGIFAVSLAVFSLARMRLASFSAEGPAQARFLTGDEPSYLLLAHSVAFDRDLNLFNNRTAEDGRCFGVPRCEGHGARKDWEQGEIYSIHTPGLPILIAPAYALAVRLGVSPRAAVLLFLNVLAALLAVNTWFLCVDLAGDRASPGRSGGMPLAPPLLAAAAVVLTPPVIFYANLIYPELPAALLILYAFRKALSPPGRGIEDASSVPVHRAGAVAASLAVAFLPWLSFRFLAPALLLAAMHVRRVWTGSPRRRMAALVFSAPLLVSLALFLSYQHRAFGSLNPAAGYLLQNYGERGLSSRGLLDGVFGILLDRGHGILSWSPVYLLSPTGLVILFRTRRALGIRIGLLLLAIYLPGAQFVFWWGGFAPPPRYMVAPAPFLGAALCVALAARPRRPFAVLFALLLAASLAFGWLGCARPGLLYKHRHLAAYCFPRFPLRIFPVFFRKETLTWPFAAAWSAGIAALTAFFCARHPKAGPDPG